MKLVLRETIIVIILYSCRKEKKQQFEDIELFPHDHYLTTPVIYVNMYEKTSVSNIVAIFGNPN